MASANQVSTTSNYVELRVTYVRSTHKYGKVKVRPRVFYTQPHVLAKPINVMTCHVSGTYWYVMGILIVGMEKMKAIVMTCLVYRFGKKDSNKPETMLQVCYYISKEKYCEAAVFIFPPTKMVVNIVGVATPVYSCLMFV